MIKLVTAALLISSCSISTIDANRIIRSNVISVVPKSSSSSLLTTTSTTHKKETVTNNVNSNVVVSSRGGGDDISKSSLSTAIFNLVKGIVGVGVLSLPAGVAAFGDSPSAAISAVAIISLIGLISGYNFSLIGRVCALTGAKSYSEAWTETVGASTSKIVAASCTFKTFVAVLSYSMALAETFQSIFGTLGFNNISRVQTLVGLTITTLLPLCRLKNLSSLAPFSLLGIIGMVLTVVCMGIRYFDGSYALPDGKFLNDLAPEFKPSFGNIGYKGVFTPKSLLLVCMLSTAYMAHFNAPKFYAELENNTIQRYNKLVSASFATSIAVFCAATVLGFITFGKGCGGFILSNYSSKDPLISISRVMVSFSLIFTFPLVFVGLRDGSLDLLSIPREKRTNSTLDKFTVVLLVLVTIAATQLKDLSFLLAMGGATLGNALIYVYPAIMFGSYVKSLNKEDITGSMKKEVLLTRITMMLGIGMGVIGAKMALLK